MRVCAQAQWGDLLAERVPTDYGTTIFRGYHEAGWYHARALALYGLATPPNASNTPNSTLIAQADAAAGHAIRLANKTKVTRLFDLSGCIPAELDAVKAWRVERNRSKAVAACVAPVTADDRTQYSEPLPCTSRRGSASGTPFCTRARRPAMQPVRSRFSKMTSVCTEGKVETERWTSVIIMPEV